MKIEWSATSSTDAGTLAIAKRWGDALAEFASATVDYAVRIMRDISEMMRKWPHPFATTVRKAIADIAGVIDGIAASRTLARQRSREAIREREILARRYPPPAPSIQVRRGFARRGGRALRSARG